MSFGGNSDSVVGCGTAALPAASAKVLWQPHGRGDYGQPSVGLQGVVIDCSDPSKVIMNRTRPLTFFVLQS